MIEAFLQIREIHKVFQASQDVLEEDIQRPICLPNCGICCMCNIPNAMTIEAIHAISVLTGTGRLRKMVSIAEGWLLEQHPSATIYEGMPLGFVAPKLRDEWRAVSLSQCPFLETVTKVCLVHDVRPFSCRAWGVTVDSAEVCPRPLGKGETLSTRRYIPGHVLRTKISEWRDEWQVKNKSWIISAAFPTALYRAAEPDKFKKLVLDNRIASAKIIGAEYETSLMWQPQIEALRAGLSPDLVATMR